MLEVYSIADWMAIFELPQCFFHYFSDGQRYTDTFSIAEGAHSQYNYESIVRALQGLSESTVIYHRALHCVQQAHEMHKADLERLPYHTGHRAPGSPDDYFIPTPDPLTARPSAPSASHSTQQVKYPLGSSNAGPKAPFSSNLPAQQVPSAAGLSGSVSLTQWGQMWDIPRVVIEALYQVGITTPYEAGYLFQYDQKRLFNTVYSYASCGMRAEQLIRACAWAWEQYQQNQQQSQQQQHQQQDQQQQSAEGEYDLINESSASSFEMVSEPMDEVMQQASLISLTSNQQQRHTLQYCPSVHPQGDESLSCAAEFAITPPPAEAEDSQALSMLQWLDTLSIPNKQHVCTILDIHGLSSIEQLQAAPESVQEELKAFLKPVTWKKIMEACDSR